ncbi:hypothetical protein SLA2020_012070 [Shorea laevis]
MRFKKGSKVEILSKKSVPSGSWHRAEIICGNGHYYTVRYDDHSDVTDKMTLERVSRKAIRPCPPVKVSDNWFPGDVVEVFDNFSWKMATVLKVLGKKYILVRLLGSSLEFRVTNSRIRLRQSWQNDKWVVIGKGSGSYEDCNYGVNSTPKYNQNLSFQFQSTNKGTQQYGKYDYHPIENEASIKTLKREFYSQTDAFAAGQKYRAVEKDGRLHRVIAADPSLHKQVDAIAFPRNIQGGKDIHASLNNRITGLSEVEAERRKPTGAIGCPLVENIVSDDADSVTCSVGSCSVGSNSFCKLPCHISTGPNEAIDGQCSDAESFCQLRDGEGNCLLPTKEELTAEIHRLELHAYRCTMEALHASGPLTWEQEALVTNLRLSLHISNDEHLMELRNLISADNSIPSR